MATKEPVFRGAELEAQLKKIPGWKADGDWLRRSYKTDGWPNTMLVVGAIAFVAEAANHHPDLGVHWGSVEVSLQTHSAGGITDKDLQLAHRIEESVSWKPSGGFPGLEGKDSDWVEL